MAFCYIQRYNYFKNINAFLSSEEATNLKLVNITIKEIEERTFPNNEEEFNAILTLSVNK